MAALHARLSLPRRPRHAARALGAQRRVLGLRDGDRARLARDDLRPLLRGGPGLLRRRHGGYAAPAGPQAVSPPAADHRPPPRTPSAAVPPHPPPRQPP